MTPAHDYQITPNWGVSLSESPDIVEKTQAIPFVLYPNAWPTESKLFVELLTVGMIYYIVAVSRKYLDICTRHLGKGVIQNRQTED